MPLKQPLLVGQQENQQLQCQQKQQSFELGETTSDSGDTVTRRSLFVLRVFGFLPLQHKALRYVPLFFVCAYLLGAQYMFNANVYGYGAVFDHFGIYWTIGLSLQLCVFNYCMSQWLPLFVSRMSAQITPLKLRLTFAFLLILIVCGLIGDGVVLHQVPPSHQEAHSAGLMVFMVSLIVIWEGFRTIVWWGTAIVPVLILHELRNLFKDIGSRLSTQKYAGVEADLYDCTDRVDVFNKRFTVQLGLGVIFDLVLIFSTVLNFLRVLDQGCEFSQEGIELYWSILTGIHISMVLLACADCNWMIFRLVRIVFTQQKAQAVSADPTANSTETVAPSTAFLLTIINMANKTISIKLLFFLTADYEFFSKLVSISAPILALVTKLGRTVCIPSTPSDGT